MCRLLNLSFKNPLVTNLYFTSSPTIGCIVACWRLSRGKYVPSNPQTLHNLIEKPRCTEIPLSTTTTTTTKWYKFIILCTRLKKLLRFCCAVVDVRESLRPWPALEEVMVFGAGCREPTVLASHLRGSLRGWVIQRTSFLFFFFSGLLIPPVPRL